MAKVVKAQDPSNANDESNKTEEGKKLTDAATKGQAVLDIDPNLNKNTDPSNQAKMDANKREGESIVDPTAVNKTHIAHQGKKITETPKNPTIKAISGNKVTMSDGAVVYIARNAEVFLNDEKKTLAALDNGDEIILGNGGMNDRTQCFEYKHITAYRDNK